MRITTYATRMNGDRVYSIVKESSIDYGKSTVTDCTQKVAEIMCDVFELHNRTEEYVYLMILDGERKINGVFEVSHGTLNASLVHPREIFSRAMLAAAASIIIIHNHPSGSSQISKQDKEVSERLKESGELLGIPLDDHVIIYGDKLYVSAK